MLLYFLNSSVNKLVRTRVLGSALACPSVEESPLYLPSVSENKFYVQTQ
jgi:hypothetical protein